MAKQRTREDAGAATPPRRARSCSSQVPNGFILIDDGWDPTRCDGDRLSRITANVCSYQRYDTAPVGTSLKVCVKADTPPGWVIQDEKHYPGTCDEGVNIPITTPTVKFIRCVN